MGRAKIANIPICPAVIFAPSLIVRAKGLTNIPRISHERTIEFNDEEVFKSSWIFNRHTKRNFGFAYAYKQNYDVIINLDDDCFPTSDSFFKDHLEKLNHSTEDHFNILNTFSNIPAEIFPNGARGYPTNFEKKFQKSRRCQ